MMVFCTLFDRNYLDKGLVMYESLKSNCKDKFRLYVIAFDEITYGVLKKINDERLITISYDEFETPQLFKLKGERSNREFVWTCSSLSIRYILDRFNEDSCTYIDSDLFFYTSPLPLFEELYEVKADVGIMKHGYIDNAENRRYVRNSGKYCVEFNYFRNNPNGRNVLNWWIDRCIECCTEIPDGVLFGDQKYLESFEELFENVHVFNNIGAGVAPWNLARYRIVKVEPTLKVRNIVYDTDNGSKENVALIFYHFQQIGYISKNLVDIHANMYPNKIQKKLQELLYNNYLINISEKRKDIKREHQIDMWDTTAFGKKERFRSFLKNEILFERNPIVFIRRTTRWLLRRKNDYVKIDVSI